MKKTDLLIVIILSILLQACVMRGPIKKDYEVKSKKVAVVSELGNNFRHVIVGTTIFTNNITKSNVADWRINHLASSHLVERLKNHGIEASEVESDFFTPIDEESPYKISTVDDQVINKVKPLGFDSLLIIRPTTSDNYPFFLPGYGLHTHYFFGKSKSCIYAMYVLELYDLQNNKSVGWDWVNAAKGPCVFNGANDIEIKENFEQYSDQQKADIRQRTEKWIIESLDVSLDSLQLSH